MWHRCAGRSFRRTRSGGIFTVAIPNSSPAWAFLTLAGWVVGAHAAAGDSPQQCSALGDDLERLACYDRIFRAPAATVPAVAEAASVTVGTAATAAVAPVATTAPAPVAATATDDFGLTEAAKRAREPEDSRQKRPESISGAVAGIARQPAGELVVTLENGQVWTQLQVDPRARVAVGDTVTIRTAALGSYMLVTANRYATRVRRVK
jgi:hypothetical protein